MRKITDCELLAIDQLVKCVKDESNRQIKKWGIQTVTPFEWMAYLTEEIGELAQAISEFEYGRGPKKNVFDEAIQAATLILKIAEMYGRPMTPPYVPVNKQICTTCKGLGTVYYEEEEGVCPRCEGTGIEPEKIQHSDGSGNHK